MNCCSGQRLLRGLLMLTLLEDAISAGLLVASLALSASRNRLLALSLQVLLLSLHLLRPIVVLGTLRRGAHLRTRMLQARFSAMVLGLIPVALLLRDLFWIKTMSSFVCTVGLLGALGVLEKPEGFQARHGARLGTAAARPASIDERLREARLEQLTEREFTLKIAAADLEEGIRPCPICLSEFEADERLLALNCGHVYHECCIKRWLQTTGQGCPLRCEPKYRDGILVAEDELTVVV